MNVFEYQDFRELLDDFFKLKAESSAHFSMRGFTAKAGIKSTGFYREVIQGKRKFSKVTLEKTLASLPWSVDEKKYLEALVYYQQSEDPAQKDQFFREIFKLKQAQVDTSLKESQFAFYSHWLHAVVRELVVNIDIPDGQTSAQEYTFLAEKISGQLMVSVDVNLILKSIQLLEEQKIILREGARFIQSEEVLSAPTQHFHQQIKYFQAQMLHKAMEILPQGPEHPKMNSSTTLTLSDENFEFAKEEIRQLRKSLLNLSETEGSHRVFQLNMNLFALSKKVR